MSASELPSESHFESDDRQTWLQERQPRELGNGKELRGRISQANWATFLEQNSHVGRRSPFIVSIFRVPNILMRDREKREAYVPTRVSLGPYHHTSAKLHSMDSHKERAMYRMMARFNTNRHNDPYNMDFYVRAKDEILQLEDEIRDIYEEKIDCQGENLALMLSLDGCFILEILRTLKRNRLPRACNYYEPVFDTKKIVYTGMDILLDILKLENQIPFIILRKLLKLELNSSDIDANVKLFKALRFSFLILFYPFDCKKDIEQWPQPDEQEVHHLLSLLHRFIVSPDSHNGENAGDNYRFIVSPDSHNGENAGDNYRRLPTHQDEDNAVNGEDENNAVIDVSSNIHRAVDLGNAGIKFKRCDGGIKNIKFDEKSATISLPPITIQDSTEILFRNLIAFEMCRPSEFNYVACYVNLMDQLIDSEEDVGLLRKKGIITNCLGSDGEVAKLFNGLSRGVTVSLTDVFDELTEKVNMHYNNEFKVHCAELVKEHFSSPWKTLGLVGAIVLLLLTAVQTIFAILTFDK